MGFSSSVVLLSLRVIIRRLLKLFAEAQRLSRQVRAKLEKASRLFAEKNLEQAEKLAQELVLENPRDVNAALLLSKIAMDASCYADAEKSSEKSSIWRRGL